jgi:hypothetical protein
VVEARFGHLDLALEDLSALVSWELVYIDAALVLSAK